MDYGVEEAVFEEELGALEAFWEFLADGLLDDAWAGEADEGAGFGDVEVAEHGEAGGDAAGGGVSQDRDVGNFMRGEFGQCGGDFCELHEAGDAFHHAGAAGRRDDDERVARGEGTVDGAGDGFSDDATHATADETVLHDAEDDGLGADGAGGIDDGVIETAGGLGGFEAFGVGLQVGEVERVRGDEFEVDERVAGFEQVGDAGAGVDAEVALAFGADLQIFIQLGLEDGLATARALGPETLGADGLVDAGVDVVLSTFEPSHA